MSSFADEGGSAVSKMGADASLRAAELTKDLVAAGIHQLIYLNSSEHKLSKLQVQEYIDRLAEKAAQLEKQSENQQDIQPKKRVEIQRESQLEIKQEKQQENQLGKQSEKQLEYERKYKQGKQSEKQPADKKRTIKVKPMTMEQWHKLTKAERKALPVDAGIARVIAKGIRHKGAIEKVGRSSR